MPGALVPGVLEEGEARPDWLAGALAGECCEAGAALLGDVAPDFELGAGAFDLPHADRATAKLSANVTIAVRFIVIASIACQRMKCNANIVPERSRDTTRPPVSVRVPE